MSLAAIVRRCAAALSTHLALVINKKKVKLLAFAFS